MTPTPRRPSNRSACSALTHRPALGSLRGCRSGSPVSACQRSNRRRSPRIGGKQRPQRSQIDIEILWLQIEMVAQFGHLLLQEHQRGTDALDLLISEVTPIDPADSLTLHQLPQQFHQGQHQTHQTAFHRLGIGVDPLPGCRSDGRLFQIPWLRHTYPPPSSSSGSSEPTDEISVRSETTTRSTSAIDRVISPLITTPPPSTRSSKSTSAIRRLLSAGSTSVTCSSHRRRRNRVATGPGSRARCLRWSPEAPQLLCGSRLPRTCLPNMCRSVRSSCPGPTGSGHLRVYVCHPPRASTAPREAARLRRPPHDTRVPEKIVRVSASSDMQCPNAVHRFSAETVRLSMPGSMDRHTL